MSRALPDAPPSYYRLSAASWAEIGEAYRNGATARELAIRWKVSPSSIYRHANRDGWGKHAHGDAVARTHAAAIAAEEAADETEPDLPAPPELSAAGRNVGRAIADSFFRTLAAMDRAVARGRAAEALTLAKVLQTLEVLDSRLTRAPGDGDDAGEDEEAVAVPTAVETAERLAREAIETKDKARTIWPYIERVARGMLGDENTGPALYGRAVLRWRAETFGPECARADYQRVQHQGYRSSLYDDDGNIRDGFWVSDWRGKDPSEPAT